MALTRYDTAGNIINSSGIELGLGSVADPFASTDSKWQQLVALMNHAGRDLMRQSWRQLIVTAQLVKSGGVWTLPTGWSVVAGTTDDLALPSDFRAMVDQSSWNQSTRLPMGGPLTPQLWEYRKSSPVGSIFAEFRMDTNRLRLLPTPLPNYTIQLEYYSRAWVTPAAVGLGDGTTKGVLGSDAVSAFNDFVLFDPELASHALKLAWKREKGLDSTTALEDFEDDLARCLEDQTTARVLGTTGPRANPHLIDILNLPDTGFGM